MATSPSISVSSISPATITSSGSTVSNGTIYWSIAGQSETALDATKTNYYADRSNWSSCYYWSGISGQSTSFNGLSNVVDINRSVTVYKKTIVKSSSGTFVSHHTTSSAAQTACDNVAGSASYIYEYSYGPNPVNGSNAYNVYKYTLSISTSSYSANAYAAINVSSYINTQGSSGGGSTGGDTGGGNTGGGNTGGGTTTPSSSGKIYIGVNGIARKVKKLYIGINGVARKVKKAYIGVGGIARPCFSLDYIAYYGTATSLNRAAALLAAASSEDYAFFAGGLSNDYYTTSTTTAYSKTLTKTVTANLSSSKDYIAAISFNKKALFAGGRYSYYSTSYALDKIEVYSSAGTINYSYLSSAKMSMGASKVGNYVLFAGGGTAL